MILFAYQFFNAIPKVMYRSAIKSQANCFKEDVFVSVVTNLTLSKQQVPAAQYDVIVVGAGPYGITAAAQLLGRGLKVAVFGKTLELWREHMPKGMFLR